MPERGGQTLFASAYAAWDALPPAQRQVLRSVRMRYQSTRHDMLEAGCSGRLTAESEAAPILTDLGEEVVQPICRVHPITGREALYVAPTLAHSVAGLSKTETQALIEELLSRGVEGERVYRHEWRPNDLVLCTPFHFQPRPPFFFSCWHGGL